MVPIAGNGAIAAFYLAPTEATERDFEAFVAAAAQAVAPANGDTVAERAILVQRLGEAATPPLDMIANLLGRAGRVRNPDFPADRISYYEALACARWFGLSLPQKSEWKLAAFGDAGKHRFPWNSDAFENSDEYRNIGDTPVAADKGGLSWRSTNGPAIHHLAGNVAEWLEAAPDSVSGELAGGSYFDRSRRDQERRAAGEDFHAATLTKALPGFGFRMILRPRDYLAPEFAGGVFPE